MHTPLVSVVVATFNAQRFIRETLDSIQQQTFPDVELIVVDDGSTDGTCELIEREYPQVRLLRQANQGVCAARNRGIADARGEFICFCDHDDVWFPDKVARQLAVFDANPETGIVYSAFRRWSPTPDGSYPDPRTMDVARDDKALDTRLSGWIYHHLLMDCWVLTSTAMIRAEALTRVGVFDLALPYAEDWDLWLRLSREYTFAKLAAPLVLYRQHAVQGSRVYREIDHCTRLLRAAVRRWGLKGPDGSRLERRTFLQQLGYYHVSHGLHALTAGRRATAARSFWLGWTCTPWRAKYLLYIVAGGLGWKPNW